MNFKQYENGSCDIEFSEEEIKILSEKKKLHLDDISFKHFGNILVKMVFDWQLKFDKEVANKTTCQEDKINGV